AAFVASRRAPDAVPGLLAEAAAALDAVGAADADEDVPCWRARLVGLAWSAWKLGRADEAFAHARESIEVAGDAGSLRLRAMALNTLAHFLAGTDAGTKARARAAAIAARLDDQELGWRTGRG
ncbi:MAG: hypothetical protein Q8P41_19350, partial [Pseudomonadota bacterium]|nr:hypothetical protein [Pseudomonadota bacterium]